MKCCKCENELYWNHWANPVTQFKDKTITCIQWVCKTCGTENTEYFPFQK